MKFWFWKDTAKLFKLMRMYYLDLKNDF